MTPSELGERGEEQTCVRAPEALTRKNVAPSARRFVTAVQHRRTVILSCCSTTMRQHFSGDPSRNLIARDPLEVPAHVRFQFRDSHPLDPSGFPSFSPLSSEASSSARAPSVTIGIGGFEFLRRLCHAPNIPRLPKNPMKGGSYFL